MKAVIGEDALDAAQADGEVGLAKLLGDHVRGGLRVQEAVAQDLADGLVGASVIGFGAGLLRLQGGESTLLKIGQELIIAWARETVFLGEAGDVSLEALAFHEHEEAWGQQVGRGDGEGPGRAGKLARFRIESERGTHGGKVGERGTCV